jgi:hypothetical protein
MARGIPHRTIPLYTIRLTPKGSGLEGDRFDEITRQWGTAGVSRRTILRLLAGSVLGTLAVLGPGLREAAAVGLVSDPCSKDTDCFEGSVCRGPRRGQKRCRCRYGRVDCGDGKCWILATSERNCGTCGNPCSRGQLCCNSTCREDCPTGQVLNDATCECQVCSPSGVRCGRTGNPPCCSGLCKKKRGTRKQFCASV